MTGIKVVDLLAVICCFALLQVGRNTLHLVLLLLIYWYESPFVAYEGRKWALDTLFMRGTGV